MNSPENRFTGTFDANSVTVIVCSALSLYNALELELLIFTTFHAFRGLYFWALVIASFGIMPYVLGYMIEFFTWSHLALGITIDSFGWMLMVTGQSVVLYSRLWLVFGGGHPRLLQFVKWMIIFDAIVFHGCTVVVYGSHFGDNISAFGAAYDKIERIQMVVFCIQEFILSGLYIWKALDIIKASSQKRAQSLMWQLFSINVLIILLDIALLTLEFLNYHVLQQTVKGLIYSIKLKLELAVLNKLIELSAGQHKSSALTFGPTNDFLDPTKTVWDITRFTPAFASSRNTCPRWMFDLEKSGLKRMDSTLSPTPMDCAWVRTKRSMTIRTDELGEVSDIISPMSAFPDPRLDLREKGSATDLLYADALRRIAR